MLNIKFPNEIRGKLVSLVPHPMTQSHAAAMLDLSEHNREFIGRWRTTVLKWTDEAACLDYMRTSEELWTAGKNIRYAIFGLPTEELAAGVFIGEIKVVPNILNEDDAAEIGFFIDVRQARRGYISDAIYSLEKFLFDSGVYRIEMDAAEGNEPSLKTILKTGHKFEGIKRGANKVSAEFGGGRAWVATFAKLATDELAPTVDVDMAYAEMLGL